LVSYADYVLDYAFYARIPVLAAYFGLTRLETRLAYQARRRAAAGRRRFNFPPCGVRHMGKIKTIATVFELPQKLGILQYVEHEPERCADCLYAGLLTAEGCRRGVCIKYRVWVFSRDRRRWEAKERWRRRNEEAGGRLKQQVADALWELAERERGFAVEVDGEFVVINGVAVSKPHCRTADECVKQMLEEYRKKLESPLPPPRREPEEEEYEALLQQYAWLRWWSRSAVLDALKHNKHTLLDVLQRLNSQEVPHFIAAFLGRFELDFKCVITVYKSRDGYCIEFCIKDSRPATYCYEPGHGWRAAAQRPKFLRLTLEDGRLAEVYAIEGRELVRVA